MTFCVLLQSAAQPMFVSTVRLKPRSGRTCAREVRCRLAGDGLLQDFRFLEIQLLAALALNGLDPWGGEFLKFQVLFASLLHPLQRRYLWRHQVQHAWSGPDLWKKSKGTRKKRKKRGPKIGVCLSLKQRKDRPFVRGAAKVELDAASWGRLQVHLVIRRNTAEWFAVCTRTQ